MTNLVDDDRRGAVQRDKLALVNGCGDKRPREGGDGADEKVENNAGDAWPDVLDNVHELAEGDGDGRRSRRERGEDDQQDEIGRSVLGVGSADLDKGDRRSIFLSAQYFS